MVSSGLWTGPTYIQSVDKENKLVKLVEVCEISNYTAINSQRGQPRYTLKEVFVNPEHVVCLREDNLARRHLAEGMMPQTLDDRQQFTKVHINRGQSGIDITVVGNPITVEDKIKEAQNRRQVLKG